MASPAIQGPAAADRSRVAKRKKKKAHTAAAAAAQSKAEQVQWKSPSQERVFSSKLLHALAHGPSGGGGRAVREAADKALATAAKGRTRWSRAILSSRLKMKFRKQRKPRDAAVIGRRKPRVSLVRLKGKAVPAVQRKVRHLGRLVPGCRKEPLPVILEEATDYIAALEMQVRAMSTLAQLLSGSAIGSNPAASAATPRQPFL